MSADHYCTPEWLWRLGLMYFRALEFDLDPCTNGWATVPAATRYTKKHDGLSERRPWVGRSAWINPPYSRPGPFCERAHAAWEADDLASILLLNVATATNYWHAHVWQAPIVCFVGPGRINFDLRGRPGKGANRYESAIVGFIDPHPDELRHFRRIFERIGKVVET